MAYSIDGENPHTKAIAEFVSAFRFDKIPSEVLARIKLLVLDSLGCAIYGAILPWSRILRETLGEEDKTASAAEVCGMLGGVASAEEYGRGAQRLKK